MNSESESNLIKVLNDKLFQIVEGKINLEELSIINDLITIPNLLLSTKAGLKCWLAFGYLKLQENEKAVSIIEEIINETSSDGVEAFKIIPNIEFVLDELGHKLVELKKFELAQKCFRLALDQAKLASDTDIIATISTHLAFSYYHLKDIDKASRLLEIASSIYSDLNKSFTCLILAAKLKYHQKGILKAINLLENAFRISKKLSNDSISNQTLFKLIELVREALIKGLFNEDEKIFSYMEFVTENLRNIGKEEQLSAVYYECGIILEKKNYLNEAILYYEESSRISYDNELWPLYGRTSLQLGLIAFNQGDIDIAGSYSEQVMQIADYSNDNDLKSLGLKLQRAIEKAKSIPTISSNFNRSQELKDTTIEEPDINSKRETFDTEIQPGESISNETTPILEPNSEFENEEIIAEENFTHIQYQENLKDIQTELNQSDLSYTQVDNYQQDLVPESEEGRIDDIQTGESKSFSNVREEIEKYLTENGFTVEFDVTPFNATSSIDVIASKGNIRKKKMFLMIAGNEGEASLAGYLFNGLFQTGKKVIYLIEGNPNSTVIPKDVLLVTTTDQLPVNL